MDQAGLFFHQRLYRLHMIGPSVAKDDCLDQCRPTKIVDMVERSASGDQSADDFMVAKM